MYKLLAAPLVLIALSACSQVGPLEVQASYPSADFDLWYDTPGGKKILEDTELTADTCYNIFSETDDVRLDGEAPESVEFFLYDGAWRRVNVESKTPYDYGRAGTCDAFAPGTYRILQRVSYAGEKRDSKTSFTVVAPQSADIYVSTAGSDSNDGLTSTTAFKTINKAAQVVRAGETVSVAPGVYRESVVSSASGTADERIRFVSERRHGAVVDADGNYTAWRNNGSYVDIVGFEVTRADYLGIYNRGSHVSIAGNHVHHLGVPACTDDGGAGILHGNYDASDNEVIGNLVHDILPPQSCNKVHGIYVSDLRTKVQNNIVYGTGGWGIHTWHYADELTISNNLVTNNAQGGIIIGGGSEVADGFTVTNNIATNNRYGIREYGQTGTNRYENNLVYGNSPEDDIALKGNTHRGTLFADPLLVKAGDEYRLDSGSPAADAGVALGAPPTDYDGEVRTEPFDVGPFDLQ